MSLSCFVPSSSVDTSPLSGVRDALLPPLAVCPSPSPSIISAASSSSACASSSSDSPSSSSAAEKRLLLLPRQKTAAASGARRRSTGANTNNHASSSSSSAASSSKFDFKMNYLFSRRLSSSSSMDTRYLHMYICSSFYFYAGRSKKVRCSSSQRVRLHAFSGERS